MDDSTEPQLLLALRDAPGDEAVRAVYADWLEHHGFDVLARFVRGHEDVGVGAASEWEWREIVSRARLICERVGTCPGRWDKLAPTERDRVRACAVCGEFPVYCCSPSEARAAGRKGHPVAFDRPRRKALRESFDEGKHPWRYGTYNPPPPGSYGAPAVIEEPFDVACKLLEDPNA